MAIRIRHSLAIAAGLFVFGIVACACAPPKRAPMATSAVSLWGDLSPVVSVKELMRDVIDPASDYVFDAVGTVVTKSSAVEMEPKTDQDWEKIRVGGVTLAEGIYLLKIPRPFTPAGEDNDTGPDSGELSSEQIRAKLEHDTVLWNAKIEALRNVGLEVLDIVKRRDTKELWDAAENLDKACEGCHLEYWYPGEKTLMPALDHRLEALYGVRADRTR